MKTCFKISVGAAVVAVVLFSCSDDGNSANSDNNREITHRLTINTIPTEGGSVVRNPHLTSYVDGAAITLTATANDGFVFVGYTGDLTFANPLFTFNINRDITLEANFVEQSIPVDCRQYNSATHFCDTRDGTTYRYVTIGTQVWMAENLNYATSSGSWCYGEGGNVPGPNGALTISLSPAEIRANCAMYGRLYDWVTAMNIDESYNFTLWNGRDFNHRGICPEGWHLPSYDEWQTLIDYVGDWETAGTKLKSETGWFDEYDRYMPGIPGTDDFGFSALAGGLAYGDAFAFLGIYGHWWTATNDQNIRAWNLNMHHSFERVDSSPDALKRYGQSVRCVRDD